MKRVAKAIWSTALSFLTLLCLLWCSNAYAQEVNEDKLLKLKTAFIFNFAKYTSWHIDQSEFVENTNFTVCVPKLHNYNKYLSALTEREINGKTLTIQEVEWNSPADACMVLFVPSGEEKAFMKRYPSWKHLPVLLITEQRELGDINIFLHEDRLRFDVRTKRAERQGMKFSSQLLRIAFEVHER